MSCSLRGIRPKHFFFFLLLGLPSGTSLIILRRKDYFIHKSLVTNKKYQYYSVNAIVIQMTLFQKQKQDLQEWVGNA